MMPDCMKKLVYTVQGTECRIWLGFYDGRRCSYRNKDGSRTNIRHLMFGNPGCYRLNFVTPTCHNGRCLTPDHQVTRPFKESAE